MDENVRNVLAVYHAKRKKAILLGIELAAKDQLEEVEDEGQRAAILDDMQDRVTLVDAEEKTLKTSAAIEKLVYGVEYEEEYREDLIMMFLGDTPIGGVKSIITRVNNKVSVTSIFLRNKKLESLD